MKHREKLNLYRALSILALVLVTTGVTVLLCTKGRFYWDEWICIACVDAVFILIFIFKLEFDRRTGAFYGNTQSNFARIVIMYAICAILSFGMSFLPEFSKPVMLVPILMCAVSNAAMAMTVGLFFNALLAITCGCSLFALLAFMLLTLLGAILAESLKEKAYRVQIALIMAFLNLIFPGIFYYWANREMDVRGMFYDLAGAVLTLICALPVFRKLWQGTVHEADNQYLDIVTEDYSEVKGLKNYSMEEYRRAKKISEIAYRCAGEIGCNANLCLAAGFYYRMGRWLGPPCNRNARKQTRQLCFPSELTQIIYEYHGEDARPSSPESALVHMVDALVDKLESFDQGEDDNPFNRNMLIYQTLNGFSATGIYDQSGMSMNQFLKAREYLAREALLK